MSQLLDLQIQFAARPPDASTEIAAPITLHCEALGLKQEDGMFSYPLTKNELDDLRWYLEDYWKWPFGGFAQRGSSVEQLLPRLGHRLYQSTFGQGVAGQILQQWRTGTSGAHQISIITTDAGILSLPWELLHDGQDFLALRANPPVSIVRRIAQDQQPVPGATPFEKPLRVLLVTARPKDTGYIDARIIAREVLDVLQDQVGIGNIEVDFLRPPTFNELITRLSSKERPIHILHFDGHGVFSRSSNIQGDTDEERGWLYFEKDDSTSDLVDATSLAEMLDYAGVKIAVLNACQSAVIGGKDIFSSVAVGLLQGSVQAVVAMSASVTPPGAALYVKAFYNALSLGSSVQGAHEQAQQVLHEHPERNPLQRRLDEAGMPVNLQDWWLPYLFVQRPLMLQSVREEPQSGQPVSTPTGQRPDSTTPVSSLIAFTGRSAELYQIERSLLRKCIVVINGFGGIGKTTLAREVAGWLARTKMYDITCFVSFEHGGDASLLLSALGNELAINDGSYHAYDPSVALAILAPHLQKQHILIIADNIESILPGGNAALDDAGRNQLWEVLSQLQRNGAGVLLTSRSVKLDDPLFVQGTQVDSLELKGLAPDDAYSLAVQVMDANRIDLASVPYADLCDLLAQLDYHPLAIRLVLPALQSLTLAKLQADFTSILSTFQDDDQDAGRNRSLLASLNYSLQRLSDKQRALLPRLAVFEGGALELNLLNVTQMSQDEWNDLRQALEQAGLLVQEPTFEKINAPYQHFHPILAPYLRGLPGAGDTALRESYVTNYYQFAYYLSTLEQGQRQTKNPKQGEIVRAWARFEFPNLRRSLKLLMDSGDVGLITAEADILTRFLDYFGRMRERDALRQEVLAVLVAIQPDSAQIGNTLTWAVYWQEKSLGEQELEQGDWQAATRRFQILLFAMHSLPESEALGNDTLAYATILQRLARAMKAGGQLDESEARLREALEITAKLLANEQEQQDTEVMYTRSTLLVDLGDMLRYQGQYAPAKQAYEEAQQIATNSNDQRGEAIAMTQLGSLALAQKDYEGALKKFYAARDLFDTLGERALKATVLHQMGVASSDLALAIRGKRAGHIGSSPLPPVLSVESEQAILAEAEHAYRESLKLSEQLGDDIAAAGTCFQLGILGERNSRYDEAKEWYTRALDMFERAAPGSHSLMVCLNGLAHLLINPDYPDRMAHLTEAHRDSDQALQMSEKLPVEDMTWTLYRVRATIAELEGQSEIAESYWRREREVYAAFPPHCDEIDRTYGAFIKNIAAAAGGDGQARAQVDAELVPFDANEQMRPFAVAIRHIMAGERDWHALSKDIVPQNALVLRRVLESLGVTTFS
jgi:tetratricopeptide (TPR) repeat protein